MSKIKVIHVLTDKNVGGAGRWLLSFLKFYNKDLLDVFVIVPEDGMLNEQLQSLGANIIHIKDMEDKSLSPKAISQFYKVFKEYKPDIVHTHASLSARVGAKLAHTSFIVNTKHCLENPSSSTIKKCLNKIINKLFSNKIIAVSKAVEVSMLEANIDKKQIITIYNGIEMIEKLPNYKISEIKSKYGIEDDVPIVGIAARLEEVKDISTFIKAAKEVIDRGYNVKFVIAGTGSLEHKLKAEVKELNIDNSVIFTGFVKDIENLINIFDISAISSVQEALCLSIIEGMSIGVPAIGTNSGGVNEVIIDNLTGRLVECKDYKAFAQAVIDILDNKDLYNTYSQNSIQHVKKNFLAEEVTRELENLYIKYRGER